jgi:ElaB/YqjD/DUF883 family membrane-anchored ribosome-binding protein
MQQTTDPETADLPEGTDTVIEGAARTDTSDTGATGAQSSGAASGGTGSSGGSNGGGIAERIRSSREQLTSQAGERTRGIVSQGLERTSEALANVSKMVGDTASGIEERLGPDYGDYARRAAGSIENVANSIASKDPDELIEDTRNFVRNSPGIALAGAAVVGFVVARLLKTGLGANAEGSES